MDENRVFRPQLSENELAVREIERQEAANLRTLLGNMSLVTPSAALHPEYKDTRDVRGVEDNLQLDPARYYIPRDQHDPEISFRPRQHVPSTLEQEQKISEWLNRNEIQTLRAANIGDRLLRAKRPDGGDIKQNIIETDKREVLDDKAKTTDFVAPREPAAPAIAAKYEQWMRLQKDPRAEERNEKLQEYHIELSHPYLGVYEQMVAVKEDRDIPYITSLSDVRKIKEYTTIELNGVTTTNPDRMDLPLMWTERLNAEVDLAVEDYQTRMPFGDARGNKNYYQIMPEFVDQAELKVVDLFRKRIPKPPVVRRLRPTTLPATDKLEHKSYLRDYPQLRNENPSLRKTFVLPELKKQVLRDTADPYASKTAEVEPDNGQFDPRYQKLFPSDHILRYVKGKTTARWRPEEKIEKYEDVWEKTLPESLYFDNHNSDAAAHGRPQPYFERILRPFKANEKGSVVTLTRSQVDSTKEIQSTERVAVSNQVLATMAARPAVPKLPSSRTYNSRDSPRDERSWDISGQLAQKSISTRKIFSDLRVQPPGQSDMQLPVKNLDVNDSVERMYINRNYDTIKANIIGKRNEVNTLLLAPLKPFEIRQELIGAAA